LKAEVKQFVAFYETVLSNDLTLTDHTLYSIS